MDVELSKGKFITFYCHVLFVSNMLLEQDGILTLNFLLYEMRQLFSYSM